MIHESGKKAGAALNPATPLENIQYVLQDLDLVLLMTVNPGFGGQPFIHNVVPKIKRLKEMIAEQKISHPIRIEVDGGVNEITGALCVEAGADILVAGSYVFSHADLTEPIAKLHQL